MSTRIRIVGMSSLGVPESCEKPSSNSSDFGSSMAVNLHQPKAFSPSGPVMK